jgi:hypothetical protein
MAAHLDWPLAATPDVVSEYDRYAEIYDLIFKSRGDDIKFYVDQAHEILPEGGELLELGTGTGRLAESLVEAGFGVVGVDFSTGMLRHAYERQQRIGAKFVPLYADIRNMALERRFPLIIAPFGVMAHLLTVEERLAAICTIFNHLEPSGCFIFDDLPNWISGPAKGDTLEVVGTAVDPDTGLEVRATTTSFDIDGEPLTLCYHFLDWFNDNGLVRRVSVRVVFRNTALEDDLRWLGDTGFQNVQLFGGFDRRPFAMTKPDDNSRLIIKCVRPA